MALATKCPHCNTIFRVAHDQLKLRGGIVRCGACNEVFDGNAALVDPQPRQPVIIDIPAASPTPATSPELDALISALEPEHGAEPAAVDAPAAEPEPEPEPEPESEREPEPEPALALDLDEPEDAAELRAAAARTQAMLDALPLRAEPVDDEFDLDLDVEPEPAPQPTAPTIPPSAELQAFSTWRFAAPPEEDAASEDGAADEDGAAAETSTADALAPAEPPDDATGDFVAREAAQAAGVDDELHHFTLAPDEQPSAPSSDGRLEPTFDLASVPDEHLDAVALHDSFELDAYPRAHRDEDGAVGDSTGFQAGANRDDDGDEDQDDGGARVSLSSAAGAGAATLGAAAANHLAGADGPAGDSPGVAAADDATAPATPISSQAPEEPGFVRRSRRKERFGKAGRIAMWCALPLLLAGAAAQVVGTFRHQLAAAVPPLKPVLRQACAIAGCKIGLPAQIDALSIEQGELQTLANNIFSFTTSLRNQSASAQAWPHVELILNDANDKPVLRRVFAPREYLPAADLEHGFLPRSEQTVKLHFELAQVQASGYHIAVFYP